MNNDINADRLTKGEVITLDDGKDYVVVDIIEQGDKRYLYLVNEEESNVILAEEIVSGEDLIIQTVGDKAKIVEIMNEITKRLNNN